MRRRLLLLPVALLLAGLLSLGVPATAASSGASVDTPAVGVGAPEPIPADDAAPPQPRFGSSQRSTIAETAAGPPLFLHPAAMRSAELSGSRALEVEVGAAPRARSPRPLFLVLCSFLN